MVTAKSSSTQPQFSTKEELETLLLEGLDSGAPTDVTPKLWADLASQLDARHLEKRKAS